MSEGKGVGRSQLLVDSLLDRWVIVEKIAVALLTHMYNQSNIAVNVSLVYEKIYICI